EVVVSVEPAPEIAMFEAVLLAKAPVKVASPPPAMVRILPAARVNVPAASRVSWPLRSMLPLALNVPPEMATVPVVPTVIVPVPLLNVPLLCTFRLPVLEPAAPMVVVPELVIASAEPAPLIVTVPVLTDAALLARLRLATVTDAPL